MESLAQEITLLKVMEIMITHKPSLTDLTTIYPSLSVMKKITLQFPQEGQTIVNLPDASLILIKTNDGYINLTEMKLIDIKRTLFMNRGVVSREAIYESKSGYQFLLKEEKNCTH